MCACVLSYMFGFVCECCCKTKYHVHDMSRFSVLCFTGRLKKMDNQFISVLLDAAGQPENIDGEN